MTTKIYRVKLSHEERLELKEIISKGKAAAHKQTHARILLLSDEASSDGKKKDIEIVNALSTSLRSVERVRKRFVEEGLASALNPKPQKRYRSKNLDGSGKAFLVATACSQAPEGQADWTLRLIILMSNPYTPRGCCTCRCYLESLSFSVKLLRSPPRLNFGIKG